MARRRNPFVGQRANPHAAPPVINVAAPVVNLDGLKNAYGWMTFNKLAGLRLAIAWYTDSSPTGTQAALLYRDSLSAEKAAKWEKVKKVILHSEGTNLEVEATSFAERAIKLMEEIWSHKLPNWPMLADAENGNITQNDPMIQNIQSVLANLNAAYAALGMKFNMTFDSARQLLSGQILLTQKELMGLVAVAPLKVALDLAPTVAQTLASQAAANLGVNMDFKLFMSKLNETTEQVSAWAIGLAGASLGKPVAKAAAPKAAKAAAAQPGAKRPVIGPKVALTNRMTILINQPAFNAFFRSTPTNWVKGIMQNGMTVSQFRIDAKARPNAGKYAENYAIRILKRLVVAGAVTLN